VVAADERAGGAVAEDGLEVLGVGEVGVEGGLAAAVVGAARLLSASFQSREARTSLARDSRDSTNFAVP